MCKSTFVSNSTTQFHTPGLQLSIDRSDGQTCMFETENINVETKITMVTSEKR